MLTAPSQGALRVHGKDSSYLVTQDMSLFVSGLGPTRPRKRLFHRGSRIYVNDSFLVKAYQGPESSLAFGLYSTKWGVGVDSRFPYEIL